MASYALTCCSTADLTHEQFVARDIQYVCFHFTLNGETYPDDLGQSMPFPIFYQAMANGAETSTSQVNISEYLALFTPILESGKDILHVCLSSGLSGSYNSATSAALIAREQFPDRKIYIVDSLGASSGYGLIMETLADLRDEGMDIDTLHQWIEENKLRMNHWFFSTDLSFYVKGGRISKTAGFIGGVLGICPLLNMDEVDFAVLPCVACNHLGQRLGRGGGYYDRFLSGYRGGTVLLCREKLIREEIPLEPHDYPIPWVLTETGLYEDGTPARLG